MATYRTIRVSELTPGGALVRPVFDERLVTLIDAGTTVDEYLIDLLRLLGVTEVVVDSSAEQVISQSQETPPIAAHRGPERTSLNSVPVEHCSACGTGIELETPAPIAKANIWRCTSCGALYFGRSDKGQERRGLMRVDPAVHNPFAAAVAPSISPQLIKRLAKSNVPDQDTQPDWRLDKPYPVAVP